MMRSDTADYEITPQSMGLDMYAYRRLHTKNYEYQKPNERYQVQVEYGGKPLYGIQPARISGVEEEVMYWRKANHIHGWFVKHVMSGQDKNDGNYYYVPRDKIRELYDVCNQVEMASDLVDGTVLEAIVYDKDHPHGFEKRRPGKVIRDATKARTLLPTTEGFFFGNTEYDECYLEEVGRTRVWADHMLADCKNGVHGEVYYQSSW